MSYYGHSFETFCINEQFPDDNIFLNSVSDACGNLSMDNQAFAYSVVKSHECSINAVFFI
jgi:hypothetical protein